MYTITLSPQTQTKRQTLNIVLRWTLPVLYQWRSCLRSRVVPLFLSWWRSCTTSDWRSLVSSSKESRWVLKPFYPNEKLKECRNYFHGTLKLMWIYVGVCRNGIPWTAWHPTRGTPPVPWWHFHYYYFTGGKNMAFLALNKHKYCK